MNAGFIVGLSCGSLYLAILLIKAGMSWLYLRNHAETERIGAPVTILQPILGGDPHLERILETNVSQSSAEIQFWWLVDEDDPLGGEVVAKLQARYADKIRIISCPPCPDGVNPKAFKLQLVANEIETEYVAVLDDDTTLAPDHLSKAVAVLADCDLYTGLPCYDTGATFWSSLLAHFVNNSSILTYLSLLNWMRPLTINGMFYMLKRETLLRWQGWEGILHELCDDYALAQVARRNGARIHQGITSQCIHTTVEGPRMYWRMMHRWFVFANVLVRHQSLAVQCLLLTLLGIPPLLFVGGLLMLAGGWPGLALLAGLILIRHGVIRALQRATFAVVPPFSIGTSILAEYCQVAHYLHAIVSHVIIWRTRRIRVREDGTFETLASGGRRSSSG